jgi:hypothetical protein
MEPHLLPGDCRCDWIEANGDKDKASDGARRRRSEVKRHSRQGEQAEGGVVAQRARRAARELPLRVCSIFAVTERREQNKECKKQEQNNRIECLGRLVV